MPLQFTTRKVRISFLLAVLASVSSLVAPAYTGLTVREIPVNGASSSPPQTETPLHPVRHATPAEDNRLNMFVPARHFCGAGPMNRLVANTVTCTLIGLLSIPTMAQNPAKKPPVSPSAAVLAHDKR